MYSIKQATELRAKETMNKGIVLVFSLVFSVPVLDIYYLFDVIFQSGFIYIQSEG
jgi:hypothetical protein